MNGRGEADETTENGGARRKGPIGQPIGDRRPSCGQRSELKPNDEPGQPQSRGASQPELGDVDQRRKKRPDNDEIAMRNLAVENVTAMGQSKTFVRRGETHPGK